ncbi:30S ribosomal protein S13 [Patescibacteria group bacterium]|nr:30S ribosomal protein S13 [Patescibacteria group bacterium]
MLRISGVNLPDDKRIEIGLTHIYGIGRSLSDNILQSLNINPGIKVRDLPAPEANRLREYIEKNVKVEGELRQIVRQNIKRLREIGSYRGSRHTKHLPVRGQQTKTNNRTVRGNVRRTMGSGKKPAASPT